MDLGFKTLKKDPTSHARLGRFATPHGEVQTPVFMPVGTRGTVKGIQPAQIKEAGTSILLANTYHLTLRPGDETIAELGGLHNFMSWDGPILTDSGGYQVFSLATLNDIDEEGVTFKSHIDGAVLRLEPEQAIRIQENLGADIIMAFDECAALPATQDVIDAAVDRTIRWARRCREAQTRTDQALFGIVQGGLHLETRCRCLEALVELDFPGYAVGGLSVGEDPLEMAAFLGQFAHRMPEDRPRYLMGVGRPIDIIRAVAAGIDMFDCVMPTRNGRNSFAFTEGGFLRLRNAKFKTDRRPLVEGCECVACRQFSRAYLRHLFLANEMLGPILVSVHNIFYYHRWLRRIRDALANGTFDVLLADCEARAAKTQRKEDTDD